MRRFEGKTLLVVGASSGIGLATARRFAEEGGSVICAARDRERLELAMASLPGESHIAMAFDAANENEVNDAGNRLRAEKRVIHGAALCAGQHALRPLQLLKTASIDELLTANIRSALLCCRMAAKLADPEGSSLVLASSAAANIGNVGEVVYAAAKGALISACRSLATELAPKRIRVNAVAPGVVETPMSERWLSQLTPEQRSMVETRHLMGFGRPEDVASVIAFLASTDARWITGTCIAVDGGLTCH